MKLSSFSGRLLFVFLLCLAVWTCSETPADAPVDAVSPSDLLSDILTTPDTVPDVVETVLAVDACVISRSDAGAECVSELTLDWGTINPGESVSSDVKLTNVGTVDGQLESIDWQKEGESVASEWLSVALFADGEEAGDLPADIVQTSTLRVSVSLAAGLAPGALPVDAAVLTVSTESGEEITITVAILGVIGECAIDTASCDEDWANGCETDTRTATKHCGACDAACSVSNGTVVCESGACVPTCDTGWTGNACDTNIDECADDA